MRRLIVTAICAAGLLAVEFLIWDGDTSSRWGGSVPTALIVVLAVVGATAAVLTWKWPVTAGAVVLLTALIAIPVPSWQPFGAVLVALFVIARSTPTEIARPALPLAMVPLGINSWNSAGFEQEVTPATLIPVALLWFVLAVGIWAAGRAGYRSAAQVHDLEESLAQAEAQARAQERRIVARDLHDIVAHSVTAMVLRAAGAKAALGPDGSPKLGEALSDIEESGAEAIRELHRLLHTMHGRSVDDKGQTELRSGLAQLDDLIERTRSSGIDVTVEQLGTQRPLDASIDLAAYRCIQEALSNAMRHGGRGTRVTVDLRWGTHLVIDVTSRGGTATKPVSPSGGFGLVGLSERLDAVDGELETGPIDGGYRLTARIPIPAQERIG